jgi:hypothetical protein
MDHINRSAAADYLVLTSLALLSHRLRRMRFLFVGPGFLPAASFRLHLTRGAQANGQLENTRWPFQMQVVIALTVTAGLDLYMSTHG